MVLLEGVGQAVGSPEDLPLLPGRSGTGSELPRSSPTSARKEKHHEASGIKERGLWSWAWSQLIPHTCLLLTENLLSADELGHGKLDIKLGAGNWCYCILGL